MTKIENLNMGVNISEIFKNIKVWYFSIPKKVSITKDAEEDLALVTHIKI